MVYQFTGFIKMRGGHAVVLHYIARLLEFEDLCEKLFKSLWKAIDCKKFAHINKTVAFFVSDIYSFLYIGMPSILI